MIRSAFLGTPREAVPILRRLTDVSEVAVVVTRPDRPRGRSSRLVPPPVKEAAQDLGIPVLQPATPSGAGGELEGLDVAVVAAYGRIIPGDLLRVPRSGFVNVHYSLLPRWRGASPVVRSILAGDEMSGVTLIQMDEGLDTGPILATAETMIGAEESAGGLTMRLADLGGDLLAESLAGIVSGEVTAIPQEEGLATAAGKVSVDEAHVAPRHHTARSILLAVRAFNPRPGAWAIVDGDRLKIWEAGPSDQRCEPGMAVVSAGAVILGARDGAVELARVQPAGRAPMDALAWMNGRRGEPANLE